MQRLTSVAVFALLAACGTNDTKVRSDDLPPQPEGLRSALENPIIDCQAAAEACSNNAADFDARVACNDGLAGCLRDAAKRAQNVAERVEACREDARVCIQDGNDDDACRDNYDLCTDAALSGPTATVDAGVVLDAGAVLDSGVSEPSVPGLPSVPDLPSVDGGLDALPAPLKCVVELRLCVAIDLSAAGQCADTARICLSLP